MQEAKKSRIAVFGTLNPGVGDMHERAYCKPVHPQRKRGLRSGQGSEAPPARQRSQQRLALSVVGYMWYAPYMPLGMRHRLRCRPELNVRFWILSAYHGLRKDER